MYLIKNHETCTEIPSSLKILQDRDKNTASPKKDLTFPDFTVDTRKSLAHGVVNICAKSYLKLKYSGKRGRGFNREYYNFNSSLLSLPIPESMLITYRLLINYKG